MVQKIVVGWFLAGVLAGAALAWVVYYKSSVVWVEGYTRDATRAVYDQGYADGLSETTREE